jgi:hypothetical protein
MEGRASACPGHAEACLSGKDHREVSRCESKFGFITSRSAIACEAPRSHQSFDLFIALILLRIAPGHGTHR